MTTMLSEYIAFRRPWCTLVLCLGERETLAGASRAGANAFAGEAASMMIYSR